MSSALLASLGLSAHLVPARQLETRDKRGRAASGLSALDALLGGGWPRGALSELAGGRSSGRTSLVLATVAAALGRGETAALVDAGGMLDARAAGVPLGRLLWIRCKGEHALAAAEMVLGAGGFGLVVLDLGEARPRASASAWVRLKRGAEQHQAAVLVASVRRAAGALGACAVALRSARPRFAEDGPALLLGTETEAHVVRASAGTPDARAPLPFVRITSR